MPIHDWTQVQAGIFHDFHLEWISQTKRALNAGILPDAYYALAEQRTAGFGPDVLTLQGSSGDRTLDSADDLPSNKADGTTMLLAPPQVQLTDETDLEFYRRKQNVVAVRHVSDDRIVAIVEIVSPGNKSGRKPFRAFVEKSAELLDQDIHLLILDLFPPGVRDPNGIHVAIWEEITGKEYSLPSDKPLTLAAYESGEVVRAYIQHAAVGEKLYDVPLFLEPGGHIVVPLEATYQSAFEAVPRRWRRVLQANDSQ